MINRSASAQIAEVAAGLDLSDVPAEVVEMARYLILDCVGLAFASTAYPFAATAHLAVPADGGEVPVLATNQRRTAKNAALLNGILVHGLDFDDTHIQAVTHVSASALPAALSAAIQAGASESDLLLGFVVASEVTARVAQSGAGHFHARGWHPTAVAGAFGAAVGAGRILGLDAQQLAQAQGIVGSMSAGNLEFLADGAWTKRLHPGWAAMSGLTAAEFARAGWTGPGAVYEGRFGFLQTHLQGEGDPSRITEGLGSTWEILRTAVKPYPVCHFNHAFIDSARAILGELGSPAGIDPALVASVEAAIHPTPGAVVCEPTEAKLRPVNEYDAKFSLPYTVATTLTRGRFTLAELHDDALADEAVLGLAERVKVIDDPGSRFPDAYSGFLRVTTTDGRSFEHREAVNRGHSERPLTHREIEDKFATTMACSPDADAALAARVRDAVLGLGSGSRDARDFAATCTTTPARTEQIAHRQE